MGSGSSLWSRVCVNMGPRWREFRVKVQLHSPALRPSPSWWGKVTELKSEFMVLPGASRSCQLNTHSAALGAWGQKAATASQGSCDISETPLLSSSCVKSLSPWESAASTLFRVDLSALGNLDLRPRQSGSRQYALVWLLQKTSGFFIPKPGPLFLPHTAWVTCRASLHSLNLLILEINSIISPISTGLWWFWICGAFIPVSGTEDWLLLMDFFKNHKSSLSSVLAAEGHCAVDSPAPGLSPNPKLYWSPFHPSFSMKDCLPRKQGFWSTGEDKSTWRPFMLTFFSLTAF